MERKDVDKYTKIRESISMNNLKKLIDKNNYTMVKFAMEVGLSDSTIYNYLNGDRLPSVVILVELAKKLNTTTDYLLGLTDNPSTNNDIDKLINDERLKDLIQNILSLPKEKQKFIADSVKGLLHN